AVMPLGPPEEAGIAMPPPDGIEARAPEDAAGEHEPRRGARLVARGARAGASADVDERRAASGGAGLERGEIALEDLGEARGVVMLFVEDLAHPLADVEHVALGGEVGRRAVEEAGEGRALVALPRRMPGAGV